MKRRYLRRTTRRSHGEKECSLPLKLLKREGGGPRRKQVKYAPDVPRVIETTRRRAALKDALDEKRDERMAPDGVPLERRERRREDGTMKADRPKSPPSIEHVAEVVQNDSQSNVRAEVLWHVERRGRRPRRRAPAIRDEAEGGVGDAVAAQPPKILQTTRRLSMSGGRPIVRSTRRSTRSGRRRTASTCSWRRGNHF